ncbi:MAG: alpha/beta hydrolase family protein [Actinomycetota bacterium]
MKPLALPIVALSLALLTGAAIASRAQAPGPAVTQPAVGSREEFRKLIFDGRKPCELNPKLVSASDVGTIRRETVRFTPEPGHDAVAAIYRPKAEGRYPTVIVQHFLGGSKDHIGLTPIFFSLAQKGFLVAAIDGRYRGERQNGTSLDAAMAEALRTGKGRPFLIDTTYDITRFLDLLVTRPDVDPQRIGMTGISEGGIITWMTTFLDDRIKVAVPVIGVTCFGECFNEDGPEAAARVKLFEPVLREYAKATNQTEIDGKLLRSAWERLVPGMLDRFDAPKVIPQLAPRPLLILVHENDELFPVDGARKVHAAASTRYKELKAEERLGFKVAAGLKHSAFNFQEITGMMDWMERWLKKPVN